MKRLIRSTLLAVVWIATILAAFRPCDVLAQKHDADVARLVAAMLGETPLVSDLQSLTQEIGGRATGSAANLRSVDWALQRFASAGVIATKEPFEMPSLWLEKHASASVFGEEISFDVEIAAMPFSTDTPEGGLTAPHVRSVCSDQAFRSQSQSISTSEWKAPMRATTSSAKSLEPPNRTKSFWWAHTSTPGISAPGHSITAPTCRS